MEVVAVDRKEPAQGAEGIDFIVSDIASWLPKLSDQEIFDGIFIKNILQFFEKAWVIHTLIPTLRQHIASGGVIAIETFRAAPRPPFDRSHSSYYTAKELYDLFYGCGMLLSEETTEQGTDMEGGARIFAITRLIVKC